EGYIENSLLDFSGMTWYGQIRLWGTMKNKQPEFTTTNYKDTLRIKKQIQDQVINSYELEFHQLTDNTKDTIVYQSILANRLRVTDYSLDNNDRYLPINLYPVEIGELNYNVNMPGC